MRGLFACFVILALMGCGASKTATTGLAGSNWKLFSYTLFGKDHSPVADRDATLMFTADGISGSSGCNSFTGEYKLKNNTLTTDGLASTKMACPGGAMDQERAVLEILQGSPEVRQSTNQLIVQGQNGRLVYQRTSGMGGTSMENRSGDDASDMTEKGAAKTMKGMFAYMADAASFINCADGKRYPVAMEGSFPELERQYRQVMGDNAGQRALLTAKGYLAKRNKMEGAGTTPTLVVDQVISLSKDGGCDSK
jgi:heat shock protein HslJ